MKSKALILTLCLLGSFNGPALASANGLADEIKSVNAQIASGSLLSARSQMEILLSRYPDDSDVALCAARLYQKMGLSAFAIMQYEKARRARPLLLEPLVALSKLHLENLSTELAVQLAREAVFMEPSSRDARLALLTALLASQSARQARIQAEALGHMFPDDPEVERAQASVAQAFGENQRAIGLLIKAVDARPAEESWQLELADLYTVNSNYGKARDILTALLTRDPQALDALERLAHLNEFYLQDFMAARACYSRILVILPDSASAQAGFDRCLVKQGDLALNLRNFIRRLFNLPLNVVKEEEGVSDLPTPSSISF